MKFEKKYIASLVALFLVFLLSGCQKEESVVQERIQQDPLLNQTEEMVPPVPGQAPLDTDPVSDIEPVEGNDETAKTINEIDALLNEADVDDLGGEIEIEEEVYSE